MKNVCPLLKVTCNHGYPLIDGEYMRCNSYIDPIAVGYDYIKSYINPINSGCQLFKSDKLWDGGNIFGLDFEIAFDLSYIMM